MVKKLIILILVAGGMLFYLERQGVIDLGPLLGEPSGADIIQQAFKEKRTDIQVEGRGVVSQLMTQDEDGGHYQRFLLTLENGIALIVRHNIDVAPRVEGVRAGDTVRFRGEYEWNPKGGVIHGTHIDPNRQHAPGWLMHKGTKYQ